ncbi:glycosyl transferase [Paracoccus suum]|uniref:Peptide O-xylosyltransferase n=1 Tax=Paracoccus suum TaxID=2259340 RepID=A0A344PM91_9RHOB|nr:DUF5928 domain-containing protein [Paracoccus suum]AXC50496.1 glycosyl transferase [Paracoccus suum]
MAKIAFILLAHKDPDGVIAQAQRLTATGDFVAIHFDRRAPAAAFTAIKAALQGNQRVTFAARRHRCGWGAWSLVAATLEAVRAAVTAFPTATHFYMLSGDCLPIKSAEYVHDFLDKDDADYIESFDFFTSNWIKTGFRGERLHYRHWFNERTQSRLFYLSYEIQRRLKITRPVPKGIQVMIGSQWWCLRRQTIEKILGFCEERPDIVGFFKTTWIPDETFFQTLVPHLVARDQIRRRTLTFLMFSDYGMPVSFYDDHHDLLLGQDYLFARKISPQALDLRARLGALWAEKGRTFTITGEATALFDFLVSRGRVGRRFGGRFWERDQDLRRSHQLLMVVCKKWHVAKRLTAAIREGAGLAAVDYLFNEEDAGLPDLGGIEKSLGKRQRHRRALIRLLFQQLERRRLVICVDPHGAGMIADFISDRIETRVLLIETRLDVDYLRGHILRTGLAGAAPQPAAVERLLPMVRGELEQEVERVRDVAGDRLLTLDQDASAGHNAAQLGLFLGVETDEAAGILARVPGLFDD